MAKKILIIEDNENNRLLMVDLLRFHGYEILEAENGNTGFEMAKREKPDLIFLDMQMPVVNGFDTIKLLKQDPQTKNIKVIIVTSFAMKGDKEQMMALGADDYISKPIDTRELPALVKKHI